jgi:RimJ/RimL family protein N-acetyltransferase
MIADIPASFDTARLHIRAYAPGDGAMYFAVGQKNRAHLQRYESNNIIFNAENAVEAENLIAEIREAWQSGKFYFLGAFARESGEFVAQIYVGVVDRDLPEFEVGYFVDQEHEGQGYVSEAVRATLKWLFECRGAQRVSLRCCDANLRSARVAERCGFTLEGHLRETHRGPGDEISGDLIFGMLRREYFNNLE